MTTATKKLTKTEQAQAAANAAYMTAMIAGEGHTVAFNNACYASGSIRARFKNRFAQAAKTHYLHASEDNGGRSPQGQIEDRILYLEGRAKVSATWLVELDAARAELAALQATEADQPEIVYAAIRAGHGAAAGREAAKHNS